MRKHFRSIVLTLAVGLAALVAFGVLRGQRAEAIQVTTAEVTNGTIARRIMVSGTLQPARTVALGSQVSGTIKSIEADFNHTVRAGQIVARLDPSPYEAQLTGAEAKLAQARAEQARVQAIADDVRTKLGRAEQLAAAHLIPAAELDLARATAKDAAAALKATEADVAAMQAIVTQARVGLNHTIIRSPIDGIVISRHVDVGQTVAASVETPVLFTVADLRRMQLLAQIAEGDVGGVRPGSKVIFQVESIGNQPFEGSVSAVRLQPVVEQAAASTSGGGAATPVPTGTSGSSGSSGTSATSSTSTSSAAQQPGTSSPGSSGSQTTQSGPGSPAASSGTRASAPSQPSGASGGVVTYTAVIDVNNAKGTVPPGGTAIITLDGHERRDVVRIPNNALTFRPSVDAFAAVGQEPPILDAPQVPHDKRLLGTRRAFVWKFENERFVPIAVEAGLADDSWTELVNGAIRAGDVLLTAAVPTTKKQARGPN